MKKYIIPAGIIIAVVAVIGIMVWQGTPPEIIPLEVSQQNETQSNETSETTFEIKNYTNEAGGFIISYPVFYGITEQNLSTDIGTLPPVVKIYAPDAERLGTNLIESSVTIGLARDASMVSQCLERRQNETKLGSIEISQQTFDIFTAEGAAGGSSYQIVRYRTERKGSCYEASLLMQSGDLANYQDTGLSEFDRDITLERLKTILYSLVFTL